MVRHHLAMGVMVVGVRVTRRNANPVGTRLLVTLLDKNPLSTLRGSPPSTRTLLSIVDLDERSTPAVVVGHDLDDTSMDERAGLGVVIGLNERQTECLPKGILSLDGLLTEESTHARRFAVLSVRRCSRVGDKLGDVGVVHVARSVAEAHMGERIGIRLLDGIRDDYDPQRAC